MVAVWADQPVEGATSWRAARSAPRLTLVDGTGVVGESRLGPSGGDDVGEVHRGVRAGGGGENGAAAATHPDGRRRVSPKVRRRRLAVAGVAAVVVALALLPQPQAVSAPAPLTANATYVVQPGDTLWSIATRVDPSGDPRPLVARLHAEIGTYAIFPGERIRIP